MIRLNLASGQRPFAHWTNVDLRQQFDGDGKPYQMEVQADIRHLPMFEDNSVDCIVAHHCLEHIDMSQILETSKEWHRILKPGGKCAIFIPNAEALVDAWRAGKIDDYIFNVNMFGAYQGYIEDLHRWSYSPAYLEAMMKGKDDQVAWSSVRTITGEVLREPLYQDANCALDWWILAREFTK